MAFTSDDLAKLDAAIASGAMRVRWADGREVTYQSLDEMVRARNLMLAEIAAASPSPTPRMSRVIMNPGRC